jgi:hypothetical protein
VVRPSLVTAATTRSSKTGNCRTLHLLRNVERKRQLVLAEICRTAETLLRDGIEEALARGETWNDIAVAIRTDVDKAQRLRGSPEASESVQGRTSLSLAGLCDGPTAPIGEGSRSRTGR